MPRGWENSCTRHIPRHDSRACGDVGVIAPVGTTPHADTGQPLAVYLQDGSDIGRVPAIESCWTTLRAVHLHGQGMALLADASAQPAAHPCTAQWVRGTFQHRRIFWCLVLLHLSGCCWPGTEYSDLTEMTSLVAAPLHIPHVDSNFCMQEAFRQGGEMHPWWQYSFHIMRRAALQCQDVYQVARRYSCTPFRELPVSIIVLMLEMLDQAAGRVPACIAYVSGSARPHTTPCKNLRKCLSALWMQCSGYQGCMCRALAVWCMPTRKDILSTTYMMLRQSSTPGHPQMIIECKALPVLRFSSQQRGAGSSIPFKLL